VASPSYHHKVFDQPLCRVHVMALAALFGFQAPEGQVQFVESLISLQENENFPSATITPKAVVSSSSVADGTASTVSGVLRTATVVAIAIALDGDVAGEGSSMHFAVSGVSWVTTTPAAEVIWMCSAYVGSVVVSPRRREYTNKLDAGCGLHKPLGEMSLCRSGRFEWRGTDAFPWTEFSQGASRGRAPASLVAMLSAWSSPVQTVPSFA
jgi:hypothetical protein